MVAGVARVALVAALVGAACGASIKGALRAALRDLPDCAVCAPPAGASACPDGATIQHNAIWLNNEPLGPAAEYCFCKEFTPAGRASTCDGVVYVTPIPTCPAECQPTAAQTAAQNPSADAWYSKSTSFSSFSTSVPVFSSSTSTSSTSSSNTEVSSTSDQFDPTLLLGNQP
jgi:hypothetical protein